MNCVIWVYMSSKHLEVWAAAHISQSLDVVWCLPVVDSLGVLSWSGQSRRASTCLTKVADQASVWLGRRKLPSGSSSCCLPALRRTIASRISFSLISLSLKATWTSSRAPLNRWIKNVCLALIIDQMHIAFGKFFIDYIDFPFLISTFIFLFPFISCNTFPPRLIVWT